MDDATPYGRSSRPAAGLSGRRDHGHRARPACASTDADQKSDVEPRLGPRGICDEGPNSPDVPASRNRLGDATRPSVGAKARTASGATLNLPQKAGARAPSSPCSAPLVNTISSGHRGTVRRPHDRASSQRHASVLLRPREGSPSRDGRLADTTPRICTYQPDPRAVLRVSHGTPTDPGARAPPHPGRGWVA